jgi:hypothetical protein
MGKPELSGEPWRTAMAKEATPLSLLPETILAVRWLIDGRDYKIPLHG